MEKDFAFFSAPFTINFNVKIMNEELQVEIFDLQISYSTRNTDGVRVIKNPA